MEIAVIIIIVLAIVFFFFSENNSSDKTPGITKAYNTLNKLPTNKKIVIEKSINDLVYIVKNNVKYLPSDVLSLEYSKNTINAFIWYYVMTLYIKRFEQEQCFMILAIVLDKLDKEKIISNLDFNARIFNDDRFKAMRTFIDVSNILPLKDNTIILVYIEQYMERITGKKVRYMNQNLNNTEERKVTTINGIEVSKENDLNILDRPDNTQEYWKAREEVGVFLQNRFKQHNGFKWIRTEPMSPKFDDMSFAFKNKIFSVLIDIKYSDKDRLSKIEKERFINECKSNNLIPCIFPINDKKSLSLLSDEHWNLYDIRTNELVNPLTVATDEKIMMSNYEFNNMAVDIVKNYIRKENMNIESYCDIIGIFPQIWFKDKNNEMSWIYVTYSITGKFDDINIEVNKLIKGMPKYNGYIAQVGLTSVENEGPYRGAGFYVKFNGIEKVYSAHRNTEHGYGIEVIPSEPILIMKNIEKKDIDENRNTLESMQCLGLDFMLNSSIFNNSKEIYYCSDFALFFTKINSVFSFVFTKTVMYPNDYDITYEDEEKFLNFLQQCEIKCQPYDIYTLGIGAINKKANNEKEKGEFVIGNKYSIALGKLSLLKSFSDDIPGVSNINPIKLSSVSDEYYLLSNLSCLDGEIIDYNRLGSTHSKQNEHILDIWEINIERNNLIYRYLLYLDPYALKRNEHLNFEDLPYKLIFKK